MPQKQNFSKSYHYDNIDTVFQIVNQSNFNVIKFN